MIRIGSLFAGIGGLGLGIGWALTEAGIAHRVAWQVEIEAFPRSVLARHWPEADRSVTDVRLAGCANLAPVDIIDGGFPCQDLSYAGKGEGIVEGNRSGLWYEYRRVVCELRPWIVVVENVGALLSRGVGIVLGDLATLGYDAEWRCIRASDVGAPHRRERLFVVAHARGEQCGDAAERVPRGSRPPDACDGGPEGMADPHVLGREQQRLCGVRESAGTQPRDDADRCGCSGSVGHADLARLEGRSEPERGGGDQCDDGRQVGSAQPGVGLSAHGFPGRVARRWPAGPGESQAEWEAPRTAKGISQRPAKLRALGNAVVPWVGYEVGRLMVIPALRAVGLT